MVAQDMFNQENEYDSISDELIEVIVSDYASPEEKDKTTRELYSRHFQWVNAEIKRRVVEKADREDVAQIAWKIVLDEKKFLEYEKRGKFRAYLRTPIIWAIRKHFDKKPPGRRGHGKKADIRDLDVTDSIADSGIDNSIMQMTIEECIKPGLKDLDIRLRNSYMLNEHKMIFENDPNLSEVAEINGVTVAVANRLLHAAKAKSLADCSDDEQSVIIPVDYCKIIDQEVKKPSQHYLADKIGLTSAQYRTRVSLAKKEMKALVQANLPGILV